MVCGMTNQPAAVPPIETPDEGDVPRRGFQSRVFTATEWKRRTQRFTESEDEVLIRFCTRMNRPINDVVRQLVMEGLGRHGFKEKGPEAGA